jgi:hypothetical protein
VRVAEQSGFRVQRPETGSGAGSGPNRCVLVKSACFSEGESEKTTNFFLFILFDDIILRWASNNDHLSSESLL